MGVTGYSVWTCDVCGAEETTPLCDDDGIWGKRLRHDVSAIEAKGWRAHFGGTVVCSERCRDRAELANARERFEAAQKQIVRLTERLAETERD